MSEDKKEAKVAHVESSTRIVINRGGEHGVREGERYLIYSLGPNIKDPDTGDPLGQLEVVKGRGSVIHAMDKMATIETESRTVTVKRKTIPGPFASIANLLGPQEVVEETVPGEEFYDVQPGDMARLIET